MLKDSISDWFIWKVHLLLEAPNICLKHMFQNNNLQTVDRIMSYKVPEAFWSSQVQFFS